jgi:hypothetical protein
MALIVRLPTNGLGDVWFACAKDGVENTGKYGINAM